jgi:tRNA G18 (ribose-2'-O)-methylase SpoU
MFFEIGVYHPKRDINIGTLWRSAYLLGASGIFTIGKRYQKQCSDTCKTPRHIPLREFRDFDEFYEHLPNGAILVAVETGGIPLKKFCHPKQAVYLLGAEDHGLPQKIREKCHITVSIESLREIPYNVAVAGSIVMYHRLIKGGHKNDTS